VNACSRDHEGPPACAERPMLRPLADSSAFPALTAKAAPNASTAALVDLSLADGAFGARRLPGYRWVPDNSDRAGGPHDLGEHPALAVRAARVCWFRSSNTTVSAQAIRAGADGLGLESPPDFPTPPLTSQHTTRDFSPSRGFKCKGGQDAERPMPSSRSPHDRVTTPPSPALAPGRSPIPSRLTCIPGARPLTGLRATASRSLKSSGLPLRPAVAAPAVAPGVGREAGELQVASARASAAARIGELCSATATPGTCREGGARRGPDPFIASPKPSAAVQSPARARPLAASPKGLTATAAHNPSWSAGDAVRPADLVASVAVTASHHREAPGITIHSSSLTTISITHISRPTGTNPVGPPTPACVGHRPSTLDSQEER
jgi:hypothetical protein